MKEETGITLIALVISIIILLILSGITIATLTGDNGLIGKTWDAKNAAEEANIREELEVNVLASYKKRSINYDLLNSKLSNINGLKYKNNSISDTNKITNLPDWVDVKGYKFDILEDGTVQIRPDFEKLRRMYGTVLNGYDAGKDLDATKKVDSWKLFYVDEENSDAFIISNNSLEKAEVKTSKYTGSNSVAGFEYGRKYNGLWLEKCETECTRFNAKATAYLCDPDEWKQYLTAKAKYVAGAPTIEMVVASIYNKQICDFKDANYSGEISSIRNTNNNGYSRISFSITNSWFNIGDNLRYFIASPSTTQFDRMIGITGTGYIEFANLYDTSIGYRPVVCFPASAIKIDGENLSV